MVAFPELPFFLILLGIVGLWRWGYWLLRAVGARFYEPYTGDPPDLSVSVVIPVYDEDPDRFIDGLDSIARTEPAEIVVVIDSSDQGCIDACRKFAADTPIVRLVITDAPGKRGALRRGVRESTGEIIALVDSDVRWRPDTKTEFLKPFADPDVGAVAPRQLLTDQPKWFQRLYEAGTRLRFDIDNEWLHVAAGSLSVVSGRTAVYRSEILDDVIDEIEVERFRSQLVISGEDKYLTRRLHAAGWRSWYQASSQIEFYGAESFRAFLKQTLRWRRNSVRSDLISLSQRWIYRRPALAYYALDRFFSAFAILLAPLYFIRVTIEGLWTIAALIVVWWLVSRTIKLHPYILGRKLRHAAIVPVYTLWSFVYAPLQIYTILTANKQGWLTRGSDRRYDLPVWRNRVLTAVSMGVTVLIIAFYIALVLTWRT